VTDKDLQLIYLEFNGQCKGYRINPEGKSCYIGKVNQSEVHLIIKSLARDNFDNDNENPDLISKVLVDHHGEFSQTKLL